MIAVTGATGNLGGLVVEELLGKDVDPSTIVAAVRTPSRAANLENQGVRVRKADYTKPETLDRAFKGIERLLLISSNAVGERVSQHRNVVESASRVGVDHLSYTSIVRADTSPIDIASDHRETEAIIRNSELPFTFLRNSWYMENYTANLEQTISSGTLLGSSGDGKVSAATRADFAAGAAAVLSGDGHEHQIYELGGDEAFSKPELAEIITRASGTKVVYRDLPVDEYARILIDAGLPEANARAIAQADAGIAEGHLYVEDNTLSRLIGRPTTPISEAVANALPSSSA